MIFDTHAHYDDEQFDGDRDELLKSMPDLGVGTIVDVSATYESCEKVLTLAGKYPHVYAAIGVHPDEVGELNEDKIQHMKELCCNKKVVAVGEIGLDYYWDNEPHEVQQKWFIRQLELAKEVNLPVIIHSREASQETFDIMKEHHAGSTGGVIHCYSGSKEMAAEYLKMGYYIGIGGVVTFKNARVMKEVAAAVPLERILIETDCPYLAPTPYRGKRNSSLFLPYVIEEIAKLKGIDPKTVEETTWENAMRMYKING